MADCTGTVSRVLPSRCLYGPRRGLSTAELSCSDCWHVQSRRCARQSEGRVTLGLCLVITPVFLFRSRAAPNFARQQASKYTVAKSCTFHSSDKSRKPCRRLLAPAYLSKRREPLNIQLPATFADQGSKTTFESQSLTQNPRSGKCREKFSPRKSAAEVEKRGCEVPKHKQKNSWKKVNEGQDRPFFFPALLPEWAANPSP